MQPVSKTFSNRQDAETAVNALQGRGIDRGSISLITTDTARSSWFDDSHSTTETTTENRANSAAKGAGTGAAIGGTLAAIAAGLTAVGAVALPGVGLLASGPIVALLAGGGAGAAAGGLAGALVGAGIPDEEAKTYEHDVTSGQVLLTVHPDNDTEAMAAREVLGRGSSTTGSSGTGSSAFNA